MNPRDKTCPICGNMLQKTKQCIVCPQCQKRAAFDITTAEGNSLFCMTIQTWGGLFEARVLNILKMV